MIRKRETVNISVENTLERHYIKLDGDATPNEVQSDAPPVEKQKTSGEGETVNISVENTLERHYIKLDGDTTLNKVQSDAPPMEEQKTSGKGETVNVSIESNLEQQKLQLDEKVQNDNTKYTEKQGIMTEYESELEAEVQFTERQKSNQKKMLNVRMKLESLNKC